MNTLRLAAAILGLASVTLGAFGAHALDGHLSPEAEGWWTTATQYALAHAAVGLALSTSGPAARLAGPGWCLTLGASVFAATLYAMALGAPSLLGAITPVGGLLMLAGWGWLAATALRRS